MAKPRQPTAAYRILVASGVNLDLLGRRDPEIYGRATLADMETLLRAEAPAGTDLTFFQTNDEAAYLAKLGEGWHGAVLNPGAWTHTSLALADRVVGLGLPFVEAHLSSLARREPFRHRSYTAAHALGVVQGFGIDSYLLALQGLVRRLRAAAVSGP